MDLIDAANEHAERLLEAARSQRKTAGPTADGRCHYCGQPVAGALRWCDPECHHAWNDEQDLLRRTGRKHPGRG